MTDARPLLPGCRELRDDEITGGGLLVPRSVWCAVHSRTFDDCRDEMAEALPTEAELAAALDRIDGDFGSYWDRRPHFGDDILLTNKGLAAALVKELRNGRG